MGTFKGEDLKMTVVHIGYLYGRNNTGGAAIASTRLHLALLQEGIDSHYVCVRKCEEGPHVHELPTGLKRRLYLVLTKLLRCVWKLTSYHRSIPLNLVPLFGLERLLLKLRPDVVHVHWLNADVMSFEQLGHLREVLPQTRFVISLHDLFMINAIEPQPRDDRRYLNGFTPRGSTRLERWLFNRKRRAIRKLNETVLDGIERPLAFVGPSEWVVDCCRRSVIGRGISTYVIPNLIDPWFSYDSSLSLPHGKFTILYGALGGRKSQYKGFDDLAAALSLLPPEMKKNSELHIFGEDADICETEGVVTHFLGKITSPRQLVSIYHRADVFAFPSREEAQGMVKVEAMLCGLPVIAFDRTACAEGIVQGVTGWRATNNDVAQFEKGLQWAYGLWRDDRIGIHRQQVADYAQRLFSREALLGKTRGVYRVCSTQERQCMV